MRAIEALRQSLDAEAKPAEPTAPTQPAAPAALAAAQRGRQRPLELRQQLARRMGALARSGV